MSQPSPPPVVEASPAPPARPRTLTIDLATGPDGGAPQWLKRGILYGALVVLALGVFRWGFDRLSGFLFILFLAWLGAVTIEPIVNALQRRGIKRGLGTGIVLGGTVLAAAIFFALFGNLLVTQLAELVRSAPEYFTQVIDWVNRRFGTDLNPNNLLDTLNITPRQVATWAASIGGGILGLVTSTVGLVFQFFTVLLFLFYFSAEGPRFRAHVASWFPQDKQPVIQTVWDVAVEKTGGYVISRVILAALSSVYMSVVLALLGVPYWLPLGLWTGIVSQFIPTIGTYLGGALPMVIAALNQPLDAVWVLVAVLVYQQIENYLFTPRISARAMSIHPAVAFGSVIAGGALLGPIGALIAIPIAAMIQALFETYGQRYEVLPELAVEAKLNTDINPPQLGESPAVAGTPGAPDQR